MAFKFPRWTKGQKMSEFLQRGEYPLPSNLTITPFTEDSTSNLTTAMMRTLSPSWSNQNVMVTLGQLKAGLTFPLFHSDAPLFSQILSQIEPSCAITQLTGNSIRILNEWCLRAQGKSSYAETRIPIDRSFYTVANFLDNYKCIWGEKGNARWGLRFVTNQNRRTLFMVDVDFSDSRNTGVRHSSDSDWLKFPLLLTGNWVGAGAPEDFKPWLVNLNEENCRTDDDDEQEKLSREKETQSQAKTTTSRKRKAPSAPITDLVNTIPLPKGPKKKLAKARQSNIPASTQQTDPIIPSTSQEEQEKEKEKEKETNIPFPTLVQQPSPPRKEQPILQSSIEASGPSTTITTHQQSESSSQIKSKDEHLFTKSLASLASIDLSTLSTEIATSPAFHDVLTSLVQSQCTHLTFLKKALETSEANYKNSQAALEKADAKLASAQELASKNLKVVKEASDVEVARLEKEINLLKTGKQELEANLLDQEKLVEEKEAAEIKIKQMEADYIAKLLSDCHAYLLRYLEQEGYPLPDEDSTASEDNAQATGGEEEEATTEDPATKTSTSATTTSSTTNPAL